MILQLKVKNYRSYKEETVFSMEANSSSHKIENVFEITNDKQKSRLLKTAIIYGANASGKSNVIRAFFELRKFILHKPKVGDPIDLYEPFKFDLISKEQPCEFELTFIDANKIKYIYKIAILIDKVLEEELYYYPNGKKTTVFKRAKYKENNRVQKGVLGDSFGKKEINVFANQLILSKFGDDEPHELLTDVFLYFRTIEIINATNENHKEFYLKKVSEDLYEDEQLKQKLVKLIQAADTKIFDINITKSKNDNSSSLNDDAKKLIEKNPYTIYGVHDVYMQDKIVGFDSLPFGQESTGTQSIYLLGGKILRTLENGGLMIVDELDTSLHPFITKMIVMIFQSETTNPKNAQLIFTTHDVSLLDRDLIRRDQVWIAEKSKMGTTELYSLQDFDVREDTPFEKWYLAGKFGGLPQIKSIESLFEEDEQKVS
jgi:AAA15 family ATPase/GTPase